MNVLILGGYGVFGERLARLLVKDGHKVCIAGRNLAAAQKLATNLGCDAQQIDREGLLDGLNGHDVVIDAAGPFHSYGDAPYRLAKAALAAGAHYLDLSDNAAFCAGITVLDPAARAAGLCVLSGVSSVPALSSAAVHALAGDNQVRVIDSAILPGNRAPRGISVMTSILSQAGKPIALWRGRRWQPARGWSDPARYVLPGGLVRQGWQIEVPDQHLFPAHFRADTVRFRAGLELGVMRYGLAVFAALRRRVPIPVTRPLVQVFKLLADCLAPFGSGKGGMSVTVLTDTQRLTWALLAEDGDGPFIPAIPARALLRRNALPIGAGPALGVLTLTEAEAAMSDLRVTTERTQTPRRSIFPDVLGDDFALLPAPIRQTHLTPDQSYWQGRASVQRGAGLWPALLAALFRFPAATPDIGVEVTKTVTTKGETWQRCFGKRKFTSYLQATPKGMTERFGPFTFLLGLAVQKGELTYPVKAGRLGPLPLPQWALPRSDAREFVAGGLFQFDVALTAPITGQLIVRYRGWLANADTASGDSRPCLG